MAGWLAGVSQAEITPPVGLPLLGPEQPATGVHDPLYAQALVLSDGEQRVALVCADLVGMDLAWADAIRARIGGETGVAVALINCSHTHSAPYTIPWGAGARQAEGQGWRQDVGERVVEAVATAAARLSPVWLRAGRAAARVGCNRRLPTAEGTVMKPHPSGACVPWVDVLHVARPDGRPLALLMSHAAHPVIVHGASTLVSADYPGYARQAVREEWGSEVQVMFAQGCGGNINAEPLRGGFEAAEAAGRALAEAALRAAEASEVLPAGRLRHATATLLLPLQAPPDPEVCRRELARVEAAARESEPEGNGGAKALATYLRELLDKAERGERPTLRFEIHALSLGAAWCLVTMPHEVFAEYQLHFEEVSPSPRNMVWAYTNGCESYIPTERDLAQGEGYEAVGFPGVGAALMYLHRVPLSPTAEAQVRAGMVSVAAAALRR